MAQTIDEQEQGVRLLHRFTARERDTIHSGLLIGTQNPRGYFFNAPLIAGERVAFRVPA